MTRAERVIVLGATGYIGEELLRALRGDAKTPVIRARALGDLAGTADSMSSSDVVVNLVGYYGAEAGRLRGANVDHARAVAERAAREGAALIHVSSSAVFDGIRRGRLDESTPPRPGSTYGRTKAEGEAAVRRHHPEARIIRPSKVFGGEDPRGRLLSLMLHVRRRRPLPVPAQPSLWANFVWVRGVATAIAREALIPGEERLIHLATPRPWPEFVAELGAALHTAPRVAPRAATWVLGLLAPRLARRERELPRGLERVVELWDEREFTSQRRRIPPESLSHGLNQLVARLA